MAQAVHSYLVHSYLVHSMSHLWPPTFPYPTLFASTEQNELH